MKKMILILILLLLVPSVSSAEWLVYEKEGGAKARLAEINDALGYPIPDGITTSAYAIEKTKDGKFAIWIVPVAGTKWAQEKEKQKRIVDVKEEILTTAEKTALVKDIEVNQGISVLVPEAETSGLFRRITDWFRGN